MFNDEISNDLNFSVSNSPKAASLNRGSSLNDVLFRDIFHTPDDMKKYQNSSSEKECKFVGFRSPTNLHSFSLPKTSKNSDIDKKVSCDNSIDKKVSCDNSIDKKIPWDNSIDKKIPWDNSIEKTESIEKSYIINNRNYDTKKLRISQSDQRERIKNRQQLYKKLSGNNIQQNTPHTNNQRNTIDSKMVISKRALTQKIQNYSNISNHMNISNHTSNQLKELTIKTLERKKNPFNPGISFIYEDSYHFID